MGPPLAPTALSPLPTPLPLNLANKQATSNKQQALLLSVLAIAPPHHSGLYSTLADLEPRWWPCQIQVLSKKLTGGAPGRGRQVVRCPPKAAHFVPQNAFSYQRIKVGDVHPIMCKGEHCWAEEAPGFLLILIYYYTPLPLNLANNNNKQASKQARHLSVLAVTPSQRLGSFPNPAILEPRWCPCQIQVLSQKLTGGAPGQRRQVGRCPPKTAHFVPQNSRLLAQNGPKTQSKLTNEGKWLVHSACALIAKTKSPFLPSNSTICLRNGPKMAKNGLNVRCLCLTTPKPRTRRNVAQNQILRAPSPPATPHL